MSYPVEDHLQILNVLGKYCFALDERHQERLAACFHPEAQISFCGNILSPIEFAAGTSELLRGIVGVHMVGNTVVDIDGDRATAMSYVYAVHKVPTTVGADMAAVIFGRIKSPTDSIILGRYDDKLAKRGGSWKIASRTITFIWQQHVPTMPPATDWMRA